MPIWLRRYTFQKIQEWFDKPNKENQQQPEGKIHRPGIDPTYNYKAPTK